VASDAARQRTVVKAAKIRVPGHAAEKENADDRVDLKRRCRDQSWTLIN
jgi:hypothetical protein